MSRITKISLLAALPLAALALYTNAQVADQAAPAASPAQHWLQKMDTNGDGKVSRDEFIASATARFKAMDVQGRGTIDANDIASSPQTLAHDQRMASFMIKRLGGGSDGTLTENQYLAAAKARFAKLDTNSVGYLTADQLTMAHGPFGAAKTWHNNASASVASSNTSPHANFAAHYFDKLDTNHDGKVTLDEYLANASAHFKSLDTKNTGVIDASSIASSQETLRRDQHMAQHLVKRLDTNGDGVVSQDEYLAAAEKRFTRMDKNADGFLTTDELTRHHWSGSKPVTSQAQ